MNPDRVTAKFGVTMKLNPKLQDSYEFMRIDAELSTDVVEGESVSDAYARAFETVKNQVRDNVNAVYEK